MTENFTLFLCFYVFATHPVGGKGMPLCVPRWGSGLLSAFSFWHFYPFLAYMFKLLC